MHYDLNQTHLYDSAVQLRKDSNNACVSSASTWCPFDTYYAWGTNVHLAEAKTAPNGKTTVRIGFNQHEVVEPVFPENAAAKQLLSPYPRILGTGFERVEPPIERSNRFEELTPAEQDRTFRLKRRIDLQNDLHRHSRVVVDKDNENIRLVAPNDGYVKYRTRHEEMFDAESAVLSAVQMRIVHPDLSALYLHVLWSVRNQIRSDILRLALQKSINDATMWRLDLFLNTLNAISRGRLASDSGFTGGRFVSVTKLPLEGRGSRLGTSHGLPCSASDFVDKSLFGQHRSATQDDASKVKFSNHAPLELAPCIVDLVPNYVQQGLAEQSNLHCHVEDLGLRYWYHGDQPGIRHYAAAQPSVNQQFVLPQTFGRKCIQPHGTVDYRNAQPKEVQIYIRPLVITDSTTATVLPVPSVNDRSFEEDRLSHWVSNHGQNESHSDGASLPSGELNPRSYSFGEHIICPTLRYYPEGTTGPSTPGRILSLGSRSSVARSNSGVIRTSTVRLTPAPTPSASSSSLAAHIGAPAAPESKRMPKARSAPTPRASLDRSVPYDVPASDSDSDMD